VRRDAWTTLVRARAIENASYAVACNILGNDLHERYHSGHSLLVDYKGKTEDLENNDCCRTYTIDTERLAEFRKKFPVLNDRDTDEK
jgi:predicted amidohydrolase